MVSIDASYRLATARALVEASRRLCWSPTVMQAIYNQALPPNGHDHSVSLRLTPKTVLENSSTLRNLVLARTNQIEVFDVELLPSNSSNSTGGQEARLQHVKSFTAHGIVTGLQRIRTLDTAVDGRHRLLVSFRDAKISLLEWNSEVEDLVPVSLHSYERLPEVTHSKLSPLANPRFRADPQSKCAALQLPTPQASIALLPLFQDALDLPPDSSLPYAPSLVLSLPTLAPDMLHLIDFVFLNGFTEPTLAILYTPYPTWAGRIDLPGTRDNVCLAMVTLDLTTSRHAIISSTTRLPFDAHTLVACPKELSGVMVLTGNALLHVDQSSRVVGAALTGWHARTSALQLPPPPTPVQPTQAFSAENSFITFLTPLQALFFHSDGGIFSLTVQRDGRSVTNLTLADRPLAIGTVPSAVERVGREFLYVASATAPGILLRWGSSAVAGDGHDALPEATDNNMAIDNLYAEDEEDELYRPSRQSRGDAAPTLDSVTPETLLLTHQDTLDAYGPIRGLCVGSVGSDTQAELVGITGGITSGSLTVFHRGLSPCKRRKLDLLSLPDPRINSWTLGNTSRIFLSDPSRSETSVVTLTDQQEDPEYSSEEGCVLAAGLMSSGTLAVKVTLDSIKFCPTDNLSSEQSIHIGSDPPIKSAQIVDSLVLIRRDLGALTVYQADETVISPRPVTFTEDETALPGNLASSSVLLAEPGQIPFFGLNGSTSTARGSGSPFGKSQPSSSAAALATEEDEAIDYADEADDLYNKNDSVGPSKDSARGRLPQFQGVSLQDRRNQSDKSRKPYVATATTDGRLRISSVPENSILFENQSLRYLPSVLSNSEFRPEPLAPLEDSEVEQAAFFQLGYHRPYPALAVLLVDGSLAIYKAVWDFVPPQATEEQATTTPAMALRFIKVASRNIDFHRAQSYQRQITPIVIPSGHSGLFVSGERPVWVLASDHGPAHIYDGHQGETKALLSSVGSKHIAYAGLEHVSLAELAPVCYDAKLPWQIVNEGKTYSAIAFDRPSETYVGAALYRVPFQTFDEEGKPAFSPDNPTLLNPEPKNHRSALELLLPGSWEVIDGYEFRPNESVLCMEAVRLESKSTHSGYLDVIAVGTTIARGEDVSVRGGLYVFEVVHTNADPNYPQRSRRLRLRSIEDQKSSVAHLCEINGYLCHCVGLKLYIKGFDLDERLLSLAFLDVGFHTTSLKALKNFIIVGDVNRGITFVAFQEDPYKLQPLGKDYRGKGTSTADFLIHDGRLCFLATDREGILRIIEYNPLSIETRAGDRLLNRTEMRMATEVVDTLLYSKRSTPSEPAKQSGLLQAGMDGSLYTTAPVREVVYKRLQLLERQLQRHGIQFAGLNPRGFRTVPNDHVSRPLVRGLLDGDLLSKFWTLHALRQADMAEAANSDPDTIKANLAALSGPW